MSKDTQRIVNLLMVLIPLSSLPFLGIKNIKRFLPSSLLVLLMGSIDVQIGKKRKWWTFYNKPNAYFSNEFPFHIGPFLVGSLWILKWAYGNWGKFLLLNAITDAIFAGPLTTISQKAKLLERFG
jgi:hypothetical protein